MKAYKGTSIKDSYFRYIGLLPDLKKLEFMGSLSSTLPNLDIISATQPHKSRLFYTDREEKEVFDMYKDLVMIAKDRKSFISIMTATRSTRWLDEEMGLEELQSFLLSDWEVDKYLSANQELLSEKIDAQDIIRAFDIKGTKADIYKGIVSRSAANLKDTYPRNKNMFNDDDRFQTLKRYLDSGRVDVLPYDEAISESARYRRGLITRIKRKLQGNQRKKIGLIYLGSDMASYEDGMNKKVKEYTDDLMKDMDGLNLHKRCNILYGTISDLEEIAKFKETNAR